MAETGSQLGGDKKQALMLRIGLLLSLFVVLLAGAYLLVLAGVKANEHDSLAVNVAGRQRMLTQQYAREINQALAALAVSDRALAEEKSRKASATADLYEAALRVLLEGGEVTIGGKERVALPPALSVNWAAQLDRATTEWEVLRKLGSRVLLSEIEERSRLLGSIDSQTARVVAEMDQTLLLMQWESELKLRRLRQYLAWAFGLGGLLFVGTLVAIRSKIVLPLEQSLSDLSLSNSGLQAEMVRRESAESALQDRESMMRSVFESAADGIITIDEERTIESANQAACQIFGHSMEDLVGHDVGMLVPMPLREAYERSLERYLRTGEGGIIGHSREVAGLRKDSSVFPMDLAVGEVQLHDRKLFSGIIRDLEHERGKDERLGHLLKLFVDATDPIVIGDLDGRIVDVNDEVVRAYGYSRADLLGESIRVLVPSERYPEWDLLLDRCRAGKEVRSVEVVRRTKSGEDVPVLLSLSLLTNEDGEPSAIATHAKDISKLKQLQEQLLQAQKLEAIGILAGGIAHDFNNLLTSIRGSAEILIDELEPEGRLARSARRIQIASDRATALTTRLLGFSRRQVTQRVAVDVNEAVQEIREIFERVLSEEVEFKTDLLGEALYALADESQLQQVLMNLVVNAGDAMPVGGRLLLSTERKQVDDARAQLLGVSPGRYVSLCIRDTGQGIPREVMNKIFDPFFTTKEVGRGTGLGLSTSLGIIQEHGGAIAVDSEVGVGTSFTVLLPEVEGRLAEARATSEALVRRSAEGETILLVEDDEIMRDLLSEVLQEEGYSVIVAADPIEALALAREYEGGIALVVTDVVMPNMSGFLVAEELRSQDPQIRVLYMSGYTDQVLADRGDLRDDDPFIRKPFGNESILAKVREVLDAGPPRSG